MSNAEILEQSKKILGHQLTCIAPFEHLTFSCDGSIFPCCPALVNNYTYGHIFQDSTVEEIWNGEKAREFRQSILDGNFKYCNLDSCISLKNLKDDPRYNSNFDENHKDTFASLPKEVHFHIDTACNARCITCRDEKQFMAQEVKKYDEMIEPVLIPLLKNAERVYLNGAGEIFASALCKKLVKRIIEVYPNIRFNLSTNGILANEETLKEFGI